MSDRHDAISSSHQDTWTNIRTYMLCCCITQVPVSCSLVSTWWHHQGKQLWPSAVCLCQCNKRVSFKFPGLVVLNEPIGLLWSWAGRVSYNLKMQLDSVSECKPIHMHSKCPDTLSDYSENHHSFKEIITFKNLQHWIPSTFLNTKIAEPHLWDERMRETFWRGIWAKRADRALTWADVPPITWRNVAINHIITKLFSTKAANAFLSFPVVAE